MEAVIDKIDPAIDIAYGGEQALTAVRIVDRGPVVDSRARVDTVLSLEAGAAVLDLFMAGIQHWGGQTAYHLTAVQVPGEKKNLIFF